ncbi:MAG: STAS domain-containing protein [Proteobacteria bacterium]|nr:MAG: STAS domain-containing protein [Pseudomonadota bacterium]
MTTNDEQVPDVLLERIADILLVVADVGNGDYDTRLQADLPEDHPITTLYEGINIMVAELAEAEKRSVAYRKELEDKLKTIEQQRVAIRELSTPIIEVWEGILCLPVVGVFDATRSSDMTEALLGAVVRNEALCTIIDITGIQVMDTATADHFLRMAKAVRMLGADCVLAGVSPSIATTIVQMGLDLSELVTYPTLRTALQEYLAGAGKTS